MERTLPKELQTSSIHCLPHSYLHRISRAAPYSSSRQEAGPGFRHGSVLSREPHCRRVQCSAQVLDIVLTSVQQLQSGADGIGTFLETAPPPCYLIYLLAAGIGLPCSEDALVAWVGSNMAKGLYGSTRRNAWTLTIVYSGVIVSDMITFGIGVLLKWGFFKRLRNSLLRDPEKLDKATSMVRRWSKLIGFIQRFSLGFRGPLCLVCGFTDVPPMHFFAGVASGALGTIPLQLLLGFMLRDSPSPYFAALAIAAGPNLVGHVVGPVLTAFGLWWSSRQSGLEPKKPA